MYTHIYVYLYMCVKICLYVSMSLHMSIYTYVCMYTLLRKYIFQKYTNTVINEVLQSEHIHESRSHYRTLCASQPALLETAAPIYQSSLQLPTKIACHIVTFITIDYYNPFVNIIYVCTLVCLNSLLNILF